MTGFARTEGTHAGLGWVWELRSVNGRGLDLRLRLPAGLDRLEPALRERAAARLRRGNVSANLSLSREAGARPVVDQAALEAALAAALSLAARIPGAPPPRAELLLALPGVLRPAAREEPASGAAEAEQAVILAGFEAAVRGLDEARAAEGKRLGAVLTGRLDEIAALCRASEAEAAAQPAIQRARLVESLRALLAEASTGIAEDRLAQEVALLALRSDVREELDRLGVHLAAARALLDEGTGAGRRLDFLVQEFVREANTLCAKSATTELTALGLRLKAAIEQLREQVQNVE